MTIELTNDPPNVSYLFYKNGFFYDFQIQFSSKNNKHKVRPKDTHYIRKLLIVPNLKNIQNINTKYLTTQNLLET